MILILYIESGSGSFTLAKNVQHEFTKRGVENRLISLHDLLPPWLNNLLFGHYKNWCLENKKYFDFIYHSRWFYPVLYKILPLIMRFKGGGENNSTLFEGVDAIIGCSFFCCWFSHYWQKNSGKKYSIFGVLGDYTVSPGWQVHVDKLFIPTDFQSHVLDFIRQRGGEVTVSGIPITYHQIDKKDEKGSVLLCGGGWGLRITEETVTALLACDSITRLIVLCGKNKALYKSLCSQFQERIIRGELEAYGFIDDMSSLYSRTDIVVTKAGGLTLTEAALYGKPLIITGYLPGHEHDNMKIFVKKGAALFAEDTETLVRAIDYVLTSDSKANFMRNNALSLVNDNACTILCSEIMKDIKYVDA